MKEGAKFDVFPTSTLKINVMSVVNHPAYIMSEINRFQKPLSDNSYAFDVMNLQKKEKILSNPESLLDNIQVSMEDVLDFSEKSGLSEKDAMAFTNLDTFEIEEKKNSKDKPKNTHKNKPSPKMGNSNKKKKEPEITPFITKP